MYGFFFDNSRCTGCRTCEMACVDFNNLSVGRRYRRVIDYEGGSCELAADGTAKTTAFCYHVSLACNHCANPECVHVCPTGAMHKNELESGNENSYRFLNRSFPLLYLYTENFTTWFFLSN